MNLPLLYDGVRAYQELNNSREMDAFLSEAFLETAVREWLFIPGSPLSERGTMSKLAVALEANQNDFWLHDFLNSPASADALTLLRESVSSNAIGDPEHAARYASKANRAFASLHNPAAVARSRFELLFALHRQSKPAACDREAMGLSRYLQGRNYNWLSIQTFIERAICKGMANDYDRALELAGLAEQSARQFHYPALALRALGIRASFLTASGRLRESWQVNEEGLQIFWKAPYAPERGYQFYSELDFAAEAGGQWEMAATLAREATSVLEDSKHLDFKAPAHFQLAKAERMMGHHRIAMDQFGVADALFRQLPRNRTTRMYKANVQISLAVLEAELNDLPSASRRLDQIDDINQFDNTIIQLGYWKARAAIAQQRRDIEGEKADLARVVLIGNKGFRTRRREQDRWGWHREVGSAYRRLLEFEVMAPHSAVQALADWEHFRAGEIAGHFNGPTVQNINASRRLLRYTSGLRDSTYVAFAAFPNVTKVWIADNRGIQEFTLPPRDRLTADLSLFANACSDRGISVAKVRVYGRKAYEYLIAPLEAALEPGRTLFVEADEFSGMPWAAMVAKDGSYFGSSHTIVNVPGLFLGRQEPSSQRLVSSEKAMVVAPTSVMFHGQHFPPLPGTEDEIQAVRSAFPHLIPLQGEDANITRVLQQLAEVSVFHFAGHALSREYGGELLLSGNDTQPISASVISAMHLRQVKLAVLSACSTATAEGETARDPNGLVRAFLASGTGTVIASRWDADARASQDFMRQFYGSLRYGDSIPTAIQKARDHVRQQADWSHPYYWAVFEIFAVPTQ